MTLAAADVKRLLCAVQKQLRADLQQMAEEALQQSSCVDRKTVRADSDVCHVNVEQMRTKLALRTLASGYVLLSRLDTALHPPQETKSAPTEPMSNRRIA